MANRIAVYSGQRIARLAGLMKNLQRALPVVLICVYLLIFPFLYVWTGTLVVLVVSIPVVAFSYITGLRYGLLSRFFLGILLNTPLLNIVEIRGWNIALIQANSLALILLFPITMIVGHMFDFSKRLRRQGEGQFQRRVAELIDTNASLNVQVNEYQLLVAELQRSLDEQKQLIESRSHLSMMLSHEFRTPLSV